jgi:hypothetical protein
LTVRESVTYVPSTGGILARRSFVRAAAEARMAGRRAFRDVSSFEPHRRGGLTILGEWSVWLYALLLLAVSGTASRDATLHPFSSTEGLSASVHATPLGSAQAGAARASAQDWSGPRATAGSALRATQLPTHDLLLRTRRFSPPLGAPDVVDLSLGFLTDHSLAPPHLG